MTYALQMQTTIVLDELDTDRILRMLYNGRRPEKIHVLICLCGAIADLHQSPTAWNGWQILPNALCPDCLANENLQKARAIAELYPSAAYEKFLKLLELVLLEKARNK